MKHNRILDELVSLKENSGNHSPSLLEIKKIIGHDPVKIDACFLSNPYATKLIYDSEILNKINKNFFKLVESYPPNQEYIINRISKIEGIDPQNSIALSGAQACIEILMTNLKYSNCLLPIPTYSSYYESVRDDAKIHYFKLEEESDFFINEKKLETVIKKNNIDLLVLINPNNPTGTRVDHKIITNLLNKFKNLQIIIDESFSHFFNDLQEWRDHKKEFLKYKRCYFVKSMSKDFGIAGFRIGFMESSNPIIKNIKSKYGTWALNNIAIMLLDIISSDEFLKKYESARQKYIDEKKYFFKALSSINEIKIYNSDANFFLIKLKKSNQSGFRFAMDLLIKTGLYIRSMDDKIGLDSSFIRVACRSKEENKKIVKILKEYI